MGVEPAFDFFDRGGEQHHFAALDHQQQRLDLLGAVRFAVGQQPPQGRAAVEPSSIARCTTL